MPAVARFRRFDVGLLGRAPRIQAKAHGLSEDEVVEQIMLAPAAVKRLIEPEEVAEAVAYLCSPVATSITGSSLVMDGGWSAH